MSDLPPLTILLGPQTRVSVTINAIIRENRSALGHAGLAALPTRVASPLIRHCIDNRPVAERADEFAARIATRPAFLSAINFFGPPHAGMMNGELFPDAERALQGIAELAPKARFAMSIDTLPAFFLAARSGALELRVRRTPWEALYELSWADLIHEFKAVLPASKLVVLTTEGVGRNAADALRHLFGTSADAFQDPNILLRSAISETGHAVLDRLIADGHPSEDTLAEVHSSFALRPALDDVQQRLGIDKVTAALLDQRFAEDVEAIKKLPDTLVI